MSEQKITFSRTHMNAAECLFITLTDKDGEMKACGYFSAPNEKECRFDDEITLSESTASKIRALKLESLENLRQCRISKPFAADKPTYSLTITDKSGKERKKKCDLGLFDDIRFILYDEVRRIEYIREHGTEPPPEPINPWEEFKKHKYNICGPIPGYFEEYRRRNNRGIDISVPTIPTPKLSDGEWQCFYCRTVNNSKFCTECGKPRSASVFDRENNNE